MNGLESMAGWLSVILLAIVAFQGGQGSVIRSDLDDVENTLLDILDRIESVERMDEASAFWESTNTREEEKTDDQNDEYYEGKAKIKFNMTVVQISMQYSADFTCYLYPLLV
jgi:hypothetical protein